MRMDDEGRKYKPWISWNHSLDFGSIHPDGLKFTDGHYKSRGWVGELFYHTSWAKKWILFIFLHMVKLSPGSVGRWTQRSKNASLGSQELKIFPSFTLDFKIPQPFGPVGCCQDLCTSAFPDLLALDTTWAADPEAHGGKMTVARWCPWRALRHGTDQEEDAKIPSSVQFE